MGELNHECGVAAAYHAPTGAVSKLAPRPDDASSIARLIPRMLLDMQNRGQLAAGMSSYHPKRRSLLATHKDLGTVAQAFKLNRKEKFETLMQNLDGHAAIGHVRYATCGGDDRDQAQPFERVHGRKARWFAFAFNGQIANYADLKRDLLEQGDYHLKYDTDTEILMHAISHELADEGTAVDWPRVFGRLAERFDGAYNIVLLSAQGELVAMRDPLGIRPLCVAQDGPLFAVASESVPLRNLGFQEIHSLEPGSLAIAGPHGVRFERCAPRAEPKHCFFEWIYFANVASTLDDRSVYMARARLGQELAHLEDIDLDGDDVIVVPVPDTAKAAADAMAFELRRPSVEGLMRNRYVGRTFIEGNADRAAKAKLKYAPLPEVLRGKRVLLVEDSIVRSTTMRALVREIREQGGAKEIHLRVACPPILAPCFYGIDMSSRRELFAPPYADMPDGSLSPQALKRMAHELGADSLRYLPVEALARAIGIREDHLCQACVTGSYPTRAGQKLYQIDADVRFRTGGAGNGNGNGNGIAIGQRTYELAAT